MTSHMYSNKYLYNHRKPQQKPSLFRLEEDPSSPRLPASDTWKFQGEESETDDNILFMLKK